MLTKETVFGNQGTEEGLANDSTVLIPCFITIGKWVEVLLLRGETHIPVHECDGTRNLLTCEICGVGKKVSVSGFTYRMCGRSISSPMLKRRLTVPSVATDKGPIF
jgi:hypothetical protein